MLPFRHFASRDVFKFCKICVLGANGGIGKCLALHLKLNNRFSEICLYDVTSTDATRVDLSHINTLPEVTSYTGPKDLVKALTCCDIAVMVAGQARSKTVTTREQTFNVNAGLTVCFVESCIEANLKQPHIHIVTNPVNALVPIAAGVLKKYGVYNPKRLSGSSSVDTMRASTFLADYVKDDPRKFRVPVIGGHSAGSIVPVISQSKPIVKLDVEEQMQIVQRIIHGAEEVVKAKQGHGAAQLIIGYCVAKFCDSLVRSLQGEKNVIEVGYVPADVNELPFFSCAFELDREGIKRFLKLPEMRPHEQELLRKAKEDIKANIERANKFLKKHDFI